MPTTVYAALRSLGRDGVADLVDRCCALARRLADRLGAEPGIAILNDVVLNQVLVRFDDSDERTRAVIAAVQEDGTCWAGGTTWHGLAAMRISVSSWATTEADIDRSADAIIRCFRAVALTAACRQAAWCSHDNTIGAREAHRRATPCIDSARFRARQARSGHFGPGIRAVCCS